DRLKAWPNGFSYSKERRPNPKTLFNGELHVLIDGTTSAVATVLANKLKEEADAKLHGSSAIGPVDRGCNKPQFIF
ncbi:MAG: hypothetical protein ACPGVN_07020, partial [Alphaproteobacteria bacterium]